MAFYCKLTWSLDCICWFVSCYISLYYTRAVFRQNEKEKSLRRMYVALTCIDHAVDLSHKFALKLDDDAKNVLATYELVRRQLYNSLLGTEFLPVDTNPKTGSVKIKKVERPSAEQALIAEANATLELGDEQLAAGMHKSAARNFHTATVYFKVLQSIAPQLTTEIQGKLQYASCRTRMCSHLIENFVHEHFEGRICSDYYDIVGDGGRLGEGSYGSVYLYRNKKSGDSFACKVIGLSLINSHYLRKLHLEIAIMKEVDHPNVIRIHEVFFGTRTVYLIMELCSGGELFAHLTNHYKKGFNEDHAALLMRDMLSSVRYLHSKGIVHRDIKLENFLFEVNTTDSRLKLIDFGLSKHCNESESMHQVVGSAYYTAPEVLEGHYDHRCDIWSLGIVAYMLLCGAPPFYGDSSDQIYEMIKTREAQYPAKRLGHVSEEALNFLKAMLVKDPEKRISMEDALKHPYILQADDHVISESSAALTRRKSAVGPPSFDIVSSLGKFLKADIARKLVMNSIAFALTPKQIADLVDEFNSIDADKNGVISMDELKEAVKHCKTTSATMASLLPQDLDEVDDDLEINYSEFIAAAMCRRIEIDDERIMVAFEAVDESGSGYLDGEAIKRIMGSDASDVEVKCVMEEIDIDGDGKIDYREFAKYWKNLQLSLTPKKRVINTVNNVKRSLKVITQLSMRGGVMGAARKPDLNKVKEGDEGGAPPPSGEKNEEVKPLQSSSTPTLPVINSPNQQAISGQSSLSKRLLGAVSMSKKGVEAPELSPRAKAAAEAKMDQTPVPTVSQTVTQGILGGISNMLGLNSATTAASGSVNVNDPQSLGRQQWTQLRVQKVSLFDFQ
mgnify:FL=1